MKTPRKTYLIKIPLELNMQVTTTMMTIADFCSQLAEHKIKINKEYQRTDKVWPPAARSYLIDTILLGYPIPKLSLYQITDLKSRTTVKEVVDGQQRSDAIFSFFQDELRISGKSQFSGKKYSQLDDESKQRYVSYPLALDIFVGASEQDIREVFRRINSYNVPLNPQERRHATFQGEFKWLVVGLTEKYSQVLKEFGVFTERQLSRMNDAVLFAEISKALLDGITSASDAALNALYEAHDDGFPQEREILNHFNFTFNMLTNWSDLHRTAMMKSYNFYSLFLAIAHIHSPVRSLKGLFPAGQSRPLLKDTAVANLSTLASVLEEDRRHKPFEEFIDACSAATNRLKPRETRFKWMCKALTQTKLP